MDEMNAGPLFNGAKFGDKYTTRDGKVALFSRFCYVDSMDFYFCVVYVQGSYCEIEVNLDGDIIRWYDRQRQYMGTYDGAGYITSRCEI